MVSLQKAHASTTSITGLRSQQEETPSTHFYLSMSQWSTPSQAWAPLPVRGNQGSEGTDWAKAFPKPKSQTSPGSSERHHKCLCPARGCDLPQHHVDLWESRKSCPGARSLRLGKVQWYKWSSPVIFEQGRERRQFSVQHAKTHERSTCPELTPSATNHRALTLLFKYKIYHNIGAWLKQVS